MKTITKMLIVFVLARCTAYEQCLTEPASTAYEQCLTEPTGEHRKITGYEQGILFKNRTYYKVLDSQGKPASRILKPKNEALKPIGGYYMIRNEFNFQH